jgi:hypothetical protein
VRGLGLYSPKALQVRKGKIEGADMGVGDFGKEIRRQHEKGSSPNTWGHGVSDGHADAGARA